MKRGDYQLDRWHRWLFYATGLALFLSGVGWAWLHHLEDLGAVGPVLRGLKPRLMMVHGMSAVGFVLILGTLLPTHIRRCWRAGKNRLNGAFFLAAVSLLTLSGYLLYYLGDEQWRAAASRFHLWLGVVAPVLLFVHIHCGRRA